MKPNRNNYEEFFILYLDGELNAEERRDVEQFLLDNPDLQAEMDLLTQSKLTPGEDIVFADKDSLYRFASSELNDSNYEEWLLSSIDHELTPAQEAALKLFLDQRPALKQELALLQKAKLEPEVIAFPDKASLYRQEEKVRVVAIRWWRLAAAAAVLFAIVSIGFLLFNRSQQSDTGGLAGTQPGKPKKLVTSSGTRANEQRATPSARTPSPEIEQQDLQQSDELVNTTSPARSNSKRVPTALKQEPTPENPAPQTAIADNQPKTNNLPSPDQNPYVNTGSSSPAADELVKGSSLTNPATNTGQTSVTSGTSPSLNPESTATRTEAADPNAQFASAQMPAEPERRNKGIRGFLRKVTRTVEKRMNIKTTDDDDRLLIAGLSLKLN